MYWETNGRFLTDINEVMHTDMVFIELQKIVSVVSVEDVFSEATISECGVLQRSVLGPFLFLAYMFLTFLNRCHKVFLIFMLMIRVFSDKVIHKIEDVLNEKFLTLCECFVDNNLLIITQSKIKQIAYSSKFYTSFGDPNINQYHTAKSMAIKVFKKVSAKANWILALYHFLNLTAFTVSFTESVKTQLWSHLRRTLLVKW